MQRARQALGAERIEDEIDALPDRRPDRRTRTSPDAGSGKAST